MPRNKMARFWDERAEEDPFFFVDSRLSYRRPDEKRFWAEGEKDLATLLAHAEAKLAATDEVVEIGCGLGRLTRAISAQAASVRALDVSARMLDRARELNRGVNNIVWIEGNGRSLAGMEDGSADACISHVVFQHIPDPEVTLAYVSEMGRILRPGGWSAFQISTDEEVHSRTFFLRLRLSGRALLRRAPRGLANPYWLGAPTDLRRLEQVAESAGLALSHVSGAGTQFCVVRLDRRNPEAGGLAARSAPESQGFPAQ